MPFPQIFDDVKQIAVDIVVRGQEALRPRGRAPVDQVGVEAGFNVVCHDTPAFLEIHDVRPVYQSEDETKGRFEPGFALSDVVVNFEPVLLVNNLPGSHAFADSFDFLGQERNARKTPQVQERLVYEGGLPCLPVDSIASFFVHFRRSSSAHWVGECLAPVVAVRSIPRSLKSVPAVRWPSPAWRSADRPCRFFGPGSPPGHRVLRAGREAAAPHGGWLATLHRYPPCWGFRIVRARGSFRREPCV